ncbi:hypothetical protein [Nocardia wallacei]|uniref:hypothetical protein n=1 Tax=Nocardia wallacei TaxID=480035 RepID=UPI002457BB9A|nr:hypothetical protein [Nocardia wallacei]
MIRPDALRDIPPRLPPPRRVGAAPPTVPIRVRRRWAIPGGRFLAAAALATTVAEWGTYAAGAVNVDVFRVCLIVTLLVPVGVPAMAAADRVAAWRWRTRR